MPEADWWLCEACGSLNDLSARKCSSCRRRKRKQARRASDCLGYVADVSWDGRVSFKGARSAGDVERERRESEQKPPPVRQPIARRITDVAPRAPDGVRMVYRPAERPLFPRSLAPSSDPATLLVRVVGRRSTLDPPPGRLRRLVAIPVDVGEPRVGWRRDSDETPEPSDDPGAVSGPPPHWRELLDVPRPDAARFRQAFASGSDPAPSGSDPTASDVDPADATGWPPDRSEAEPPRP